MTQTPHSCEQEIQGVLLRATHARIATMQFFESHDTPMDAQHLSVYLHKEISIDRVTVFRILNAFVEKGLIRKLTFGEGKARYELNNKEHHHLICQTCGRIEDMPDCHMGAFESEIKRQKKFLVKQHSLEFFGLCARCQG